MTERACPGSGTVTFTWTAENRLASLTVNGQTTTFDYNAAGRLVKKTTAGVARHFLVASADEHKDTRSPRAQRGSVPERWRSEPPLRRPSARHAA